MKKYDAHLSLSVCTCKMGNKELSLPPLQNSNKGKQMEGVNKLSK